LYRTHVLINSVTINQDYLILDCIEYEAIAVASVRRQFAIASSFYCPRPGLQSTKPSASVSRKLAIAISITASIGHSISAVQVTKAV
jgi:hypothetical protein